MIALFSFDDVSVCRDDTVVLDAITLEIPVHGITVLVGASGSGKSTLLRCCNRLEARSSGAIHYRGDDLATLDPLVHRRRVAMVFQTPTVFAGTGLDNLRAADAHLSADDARVLLTREGLPHDLLDREADTLSGGEAHCLCLARALATRPQAILADESTSALDHASTAVLERLVRQLADDGIPVVWVTHDLAQMERLADRVIELEDGRIPVSVVVAVGRGHHRLRRGHDHPSRSGRARTPGRHPPGERPRRCQRAAIEAGLALGMSVPRASARIIRSSLRTAISPQIEQTAALGIVFLPGAMTGLILAGADPLEAVRTQLALMYVILAGVVIAAVITGLGTLRQLTTDQQTLLRVARR